MKKTTARTRPAQPVTPRPVTDPQLAALLGFLEGVGHASHEHHATMNAIAGAILADVPASLAGLAGHPSIFHSVTNGVLDMYRKSGADSQSEATLLEEILSFGDKNITITDSTPAFSVLVSCVNDAAIVGACLMYRILKGGAR